MCLGNGSGNFTLLYFLTVWKVILVSPIPVLLKQINISDIKALASF